MDSLISLCVFWGLGDSSILPSVLPFSDLVTRLWEGLRSSILLGGQRSEAPPLCRSTPSRHPQTAGEAGRKTVEDTAAGSWGRWSQGRVPACSLTQPAEMIAHCWGVDFRVASPHPAPGLLLGGVEAPPGTPLESAAARSLALSTRAHRSKPTLPQDWPGSSLATVTGEFSDTDPWSWGRAREPGVPSAGATPGASCPLCPAPALVLGPSPTLFQAGP